MRRTITAIGALFFTNGAAFASWAPRIPEIADRAGLDVAGLGLTLLLLGVGGLAGTHPAGLAIDRVGSRRTAVTGGLVVAVSLAIIGSSGSVPMLGVALFVLGAADVSADLGMNAQAMVAQQGRPPIINRLHGLWSIGTVVGGVVGAAAASVGVSLASHLSGAGLVVAAVTVVANRSLLDDAIAPPEPDAVDAPASSRRPLVVLGLLGFLAAFVEAPGNEWSATFMDEVLDASPAIAALGFVAFTVGMTTSRLWGDSIALRLDQRRAFVASLSMTAVGWAIASLVGGIAAAIGGLLVAGLGAGMVFPGLYAAGGSGSVVSQGRGLSAMSLGARLGFLLVAPAVGLAGSTVGLDVALPALVGIAALLAALLTWREG